MRTTILISLLFGIILCCLICCATKQPSTGSAMQDLKKALIKGKDYSANGLTFEGDLDFDLIFNNMGNSIYIESQLRFTNCTFKGNIDWSRQENRRLYFQKDVIFKGCTFEGEFKINDAVYYSLFQMDDNLFRSSLDIQRSKFIVNCRIDNNEIGQDVILQYSNYQDHLSVFGNTIGNHLLMQAIQVQGDAQFSNSQVNNAIDLSNSYFHQNIIMDYAEGGTKLLVGNSTVLGRFEIKYLDGFETVDFSDCDFRGYYLYINQNESIKPILDQAKFRS